MTDLSVQRRLASHVLKCGESRVWLDPLHADEIAVAVTREDVRKLAGKGFVKRHQAQGTSRGRARAHDRQKAKGRRSGPGSREGAKGARRPSKAAWMRRIRAIRDELRKLREAGTIDAHQYRHYYLRAKGGVYNSRAHLLLHLRTDGVITERATPPPGGER